MEAVESKGISTELYGRNIPIQLIPAILMRGPDCRIDAASSTESIPWRVGLILCMCGIDVVDPCRRFPQNCMEDFSIPIQLMPECLSASSAAAVIAALEGPPQSSRIEAVGLGDRSGCLCRGSELIRVQWRVL